jgi:hypothetical protein
MVPEALASARRHAQIQNQGRNIRWARHIGVVYSSSRFPVTVLSTALIMFQGAFIFQQEQPAFVFVAKLQQLDAKYPIDESSTLSDVVAYMVALGEVISILYPEFDPEHMAQVAQVHQVFSQVLPEHNENVRKILHDVHKIFARGDQPFTEETANEVLETFDRFRVEIGKMRETMPSGERGGNAEGWKNDEGSSGKSN